MIKIVGLSGSPRHGSTETAVKAALNEIERCWPGQVETKYLSLAGKKITPCSGCNYCRTKNKPCCFVGKDDVDSVMQEFLSADAYVIGSPVYVHTVAPQLIGFFSRMRSYCNLNPDAVAGKFGVPVSVGGTRNGGEEGTDLTIIQMLMAKGINVVSGEDRGYLGGKVWSKDKKDLTEEDDAEGFETVRGAARKLARTVLCYDLGKKAMETLTSK